MKNGVEKISSEIIINSTDDIHGAIELLLARRLERGLAILGEEDWVEGSQRSYVDANGITRGYEYTATDVLKQRLSKIAEWEQLNKFFALDEAMAELKAKHLQKTFEIKEIPILNTYD